VTAFKAIYLRELRAYFFSPIAYVLLVGFLLISGYFFYSGVAFYSMASLQAAQNPLMFKLNLQQMLVAPLMSNMSVIMMFVAPLLTMRLLSEEKRSGTLELLLSYPLGDMCVVLAKFLAAWTVLGLILALSGVQYVILSWMGPVHWPGVASGYLGLILLGGGFLALGVLASAATENQIVAAVSAFAGLLFLWILAWSTRLLGPQAAELLKALSLAAHFEKFPQGLIDTADLAYYLLFMGLFLFLSIRTLEVKRWKA
jgi:ABC-2 type transport system permease protein